MTGCSAPGREQDPAGPGQTGPDRTAPDLAGTGRTPSEAEWLRVTAALNRDRYELAVRAAEIGRASCRERV